MQIAVLGSATSWHVGDLRRAAGDRHAIVPVTYREMCSRVSPAGTKVSSGQCDLDQFGAVLVRSMPPGSLEQIGAALYLQQFVAHEGCDWRLLVLGDEVLGMRRRHPHDWRTNISRGAVAEPLEVTAELAELARRAAGAVGATVAGVDLLPGQDGQLYAIEVNAVPGWRALAEVTRLDVAQRVLRILE